MLSSRESSRFKKDYARLERRGYNMQLIDDVMDDIVQGIKLDPAYRDHGLEPKKEGRRELHIDGRKSDWLLVYFTVEYEHEKRYVVFDRTGTHSDLFG
jgi:mRNA interferase YafQ